MKPQPRRVRAVFAGSRPVRSRYVKNWPHLQSRQIYHGAGSLSREQQRVLNQQGTKRAYLPSTANPPAPTPTPPDKKDMMPLLFIGGLLLKALM